MYCHKLEKGENNRSLLLSFNLFDHQLQNQSTISPLAFHVTRAFAGSIILLSIASQFAAAIS